MVPPSLTTLPPMGTWMGKKNPFLIQSLISYFFINYENDMLRIYEI